MSTNTMEKTDSRPDLGFLRGVSVLVVGDVMLDRYLWGDIHRISPEAPVPVVEIQRETHTAGGAANVALNLAALGVRCELFGVIGNDANGAELRALLASRGVVHDPALVRPATPTITKTRVIAQRQQVCRLDREAQPEGYSLSDLDTLSLLAAKIPSYRAVIVSDYAKGSIDQPLINRVRQETAAANVFLALDPKPKRALDVSGFDLITPNRTEAWQFAEMEGRIGDPAHLSEVCRRIQSKYQPKYLVITLSEQGMLLVPRDGATTSYPTAARQVADVSGAGDTVVATLTAGFAGGLTPEESVRLANLAAGVVVSKLGTAVVTPEEIATAWTHFAG